MIDYKIGHYYERIYSASKHEIMFVIRGLGSNCDEMLVTVLHSNNRMIKKDFDAYLGCSDVYDSTTKEISKSELIAKIL